MEIELDVATRADVAAVEQPRIEALAKRLASVPVATVADFPAPRSAGGPNDFSSEGDYWWPDPEDPDGPYVRRDGESNPSMFTAHREAMRSFSRAVGAFSCAFELTRDSFWAGRARAHLRAWLVDPKTAMTPHLRYGQAIPNLCPGRGIGLVDTTHLCDVALAARKLERLGALPGEEAAAIRRWFQDFTDWMRRDPMGIDERDHGNNHSTCWALQVACFARLTGDEAALAEAARQLRGPLLAQMDERGAFPEELARTRPYNYSLFNLDLAYGLARAVSPEFPGVWSWASPAGTTLEAAAAFHAPFIADRGAWPFARDIAGFEDLPNRGPALLLAAAAYQNLDWLETWKALEPDPQDEEAQRNLPLRYPLLWFD